MKSKSFRVGIIFCAFFVSCFIYSNISLAFDDLTTHPALTDEVVDFYNLFSEQKITSEEKETIISGAMSEDTPPRWINHFYDPTRNIGWTGRNTGIWPTSFSKFNKGLPFVIQSKSSWGGIRLYPGSHSNISGATFEYANTALTYDDSSPINLSNVRFYENNLAVSGSVVQLVNPSTIEFISNAATTSPSGLW